MKTKNRLYLLAVTAAALSLNATTPNLWAVPPRQHSASGVVQVIDCANRTMTLTTKDGAAPLTFVWNDSTRFSRTGGCIKRSLSSKQTVRVWYRREVGQNVLREVTSKDASTECGAVFK